MLGLSFSHSLKSLGDESIEWGRLSDCTVLVDVKVMKDNYKVKKHFLYYWYDHVSLISLICWYDGLNELIFKMLNLIK